MELSWRRIGLACSGLGLGGSLLALLAADLLPWWWWSELWQHPRPQLALGSLVCAIGCGLLLRVRWRWCALAVPLWAFAGMLPVLAAGASGASGPGGLTLLAANVHSSNPDPAAAIARLRALDADVVVLLEPDHGWTQALQALRDAYPVHCEILRDDNFGICAYARHGSITVWQPAEVEVPGLIIAVDGIELLALHPPPPFSAAYHDWWRSELAAAASWAASRPRAVVAGDLNTTPWSDGYRRLCRSGGLRGPGGWAAWRPTWMAGTPLAAPIDHVLVGAGLGLAQHAVGPDIASDHRPVLVRIIPPVGPGPAVAPGGTPAGP